MNPMRYSGGLLGGSWLTALTSDIGNGKFDGAWLVQNFENLNPANTLWSKQYNLYSKVDTEAERYLSFEKWWGGHVFLNGTEIQYIVDKLFVGNRLATAGLVTSDGIRIDLRNIRSPIVVFCSKGDNIRRRRRWAGSQTFIRTTPKCWPMARPSSTPCTSIGHLGIFVSGSVARKEHQEFTSNIDMIDVLPPGIYQAEIADKTPDTPNADLAQGNYVLSFEERHLDDVRAIVDRKEDDDRRFAAVARISDINLGMYRSFVQPWLRATVTPQSAEWLQRLHPLRLPYELISDRNPLVSPIARVAEQVREHRQPVSSANPFLMTQEMVSNWIETSLNIWQELRDSAAERSFMSIYGSPVVQDLAGLGAQDGLPRRHPGVSPEHRDFMAARAAELRSQLQEGGLLVAAVRMLLRGRRRGWPGRTQFRADPQNARRIKQRHHAAGIQDLTRDQALMLTLDAPAAIQAMPRLLEGETPAAIRTALDEMKRVLEAAEPLSAAARESLDEMEHIFEAAARAEHHGRDGRATQGRGRAQDRRAGAPARQGRRGRSRHRAPERPRSRPPAHPP